MSSPPVAVWGLELRHVYHRPIDRQHGQVDGPALRNKPPVAVEQGVPAVKDALATGLDDTVHLNVAKYVDRRDSSDDKGRQRKSVPDRTATTGARRSVLNGCREWP